MGAVASIINEVFAPTIRVEGVVMTREDGTEVTSLYDEDDFSEVDIVLGSDRSTNQRLLYVVISAIHASTVQITSKVEDKKSHRKWKTKEQQNEAVTNKTMRETTFIENKNTTNQSRIVDREERDENGNTKYINIGSIVEVENEDRRSERNTWQSERTDYPHTLTTSQSEYTEGPSTLNTGRTQHNEKVNVKKLEHSEESKELRNKQYTSNDEPQEFEAKQVEHAEESKHFKHTEEFRTLNPDRIDETQTINSSENRRQIRPQSYVIHSNGKKENHNDEVWNKGDEEDSGHIAEQIDSGHITEQTDSESVKSLVIPARSQSKENTVVHKTYDETKLNRKMEETTDNQMANVNRSPIEGLRNDRNDDRHATNDSYRDSDDSRNETVLEHREHETKEENMQIEVVTVIGPFPSDRPPPEADRLLNSGRPLDSDRSNKSNRSVASDGLIELDVESEMDIEFDNESKGDENEVVHTTAKSKGNKGVQKANDKNKTDKKKGKTSDNSTKARSIKDDRHNDRRKANKSISDTDYNTDETDWGNREDDGEMMQEGSQSTDIDLDVYAKQVPKTVLCSFKDLLEYFDKPLKDNGNREELLIRSFLIWLGGLDIPESKYQPIKDITQNDTRSPDELMNLLRKNLNAYTSIFSLLCWAAEIQCTRIKGISRTGDCDNSTKSEWVAVYINNKWKIVHPYRICLALSGKLTRKVLKVNGDEVTEDDVNMLKESFLDHYIFAKPEWFIYEYYPNDPAWQLIFEPIAEEHFWKQELLYHPWWDLGLRLTNKRQHALTSDSGKISITIDGTAETPNDLVVWYDFSLIKGDPSGNNNVKSPDQEYLQRLVMLIRNKSSFVCNILLPVEGQYKIVFYGGKSLKAVLAISEFEINCSQCYSEPILLPIDPGMTGIGPGLATSIAGLAHTFPTNGLIQVDIGKTTKLRSSVGHKMSAKFKVKADIMSFVTATGPESTNTIFGLTECTLVKKGDGQGVLITVKSPEKPGHYLLEVKTTRNGSTWFTACYYILVYKPVKVVVLERCSQKMARKELHNATEKTDGLKIMATIQECITKRIDGNDPEIQKARGRIANLKKTNQKKKKNFAFTEVHPHETLLMFNIIRQREYERFLHELYKYLRDFHNYLTSVCTPSPGEAPDMQALAHEEKHVILIVLTLFGRSADEGKDSMQQIQEILKDLNETGLVLTHDNVKKTALVINKFTQSEIKYVNFAAGRVFTIVNDIVSWMARI